MCMNTPAPTTIPVTGFLFQRGMVYTARLAAAATNKPGHTTTRNKKESHRPHSVGGFSLLDASY